MNLNRVQNELNDAYNALQAVGEMTVEENTTLVMAEAQVHATLAVAEALIALHQLIDWYMSSHR